MALSRYNSNDSINPLIYGRTASSPGTSAAQIKSVTGTNTNGIYYITLGNVGVQPVYCIMDSAVSGGGWMVLWGTPSGSTTFTVRFSADRNNQLITDPIADNYSLNYANRSGVRAICSQTQSLVYISNSGWMRLSGYIWNSSSHSAGNYLFESTVSAVTSNGTTDASVAMGTINYNNGNGGDLGISSTTLDHHSTDYYNLNSGCSPMYLYQYGAGYKVNTSFSGWSNATNSCSAAYTNDIGFLVAMR